MRGCNAGRIGSAIVRTKIACEADNSAEPPGGHAERVKPGDIDECEEPAVGEMDKEADDLRFVAVGSEHRAEQIRDVHRCQTKSLAGSKNGGEHDGAGKPPEQPVQPVHSLRSTLW